MFSDTITITINAVAKVLTRINQDKYSSEYLLRGTADEFRLTIRNTNYTDKPCGGKVVDRHAVELVQTVYPVSPSTIPVIRKAYAVLENERTDGIVDPVKFDAGFVAFFTEPNITKLVNLES